MTAKLTIGAGTITIAFTHTGQTQVMTDVLTSAAHMVYIRKYGVEPGPEVTAWEAMSNQQRADLLDDHVKQIVLDLANADYINTAQEAARVTAQAESKIKFML